MNRWAIVSRPLKRGLDRNPFCAKLPATSLVLLAPQELNVRLTTGLVVYRLAVINIPLPQNSGFVMLSGAINILLLTDPNN
jgi:hypothetical protein